MPETQKYLKGQLLLDSGELSGSFFQRTVLLICQHDAEGAFGLILNKPTEMRVHEVVEDFPVVDNLIFYGGPVQPNTLHYLHRRGDLLADSTEVKDGIYWGGDFERLIFLLETKQISQEEIRFFFGYSGWEKGQLTRELKDNSWFIGDGIMSYLFEEEPKQLWRTALRNMGDRYRVIANFPENPSLN